MAGEASSMAKPAAPASTSANKSGPNKSGPDKSGHAKPSHVKPLDLIVSSRDELNLAEFPFSLLTDRTYRDRNSITIEREVTDAATSRTTRQAWTATGNEKNGLPTARDMDVYVALMQIAARDGVDKDRKIYFSRYELVKMQRRVPCQPTYEQLERSLKRLVGVTIYAEDAFFDAKTRRRTSQAFGILDNYKLEDCSVREARAGAKQLELRFHRSWVMLNAVLHEQLERNGVKNLDTETYFALDYPVSRRLFRFLDRVRAQDAREYSIDLPHLARLMPLHDTRASRQLRDLAKAHDELVGVGYLERVDQQKSTSRVNGYGGANGPGAGHGSGEVGAIRLVYTFATDPKAQLLVARGITPSIARTLAERFPDRIERQVQAFDRRLRGKKIQNPAGFLRSSIEGDWNEPAQIERPKAHSATRAVARPEMRERKLLAELFQSLSPDVQRELEERARRLAREELGEGASEHRLELTIARKREEILREHQPPH
jgi:hypothetical protein